MNDRLLAEVDTNSGPTEYILHQAEALRSDVAPESSAASVGLSTITLTKVPDTRTSGRVSVRARVMQMAPWLLNTFAAAGLIAVAGRAAAAWPVAFNFMVDHDCVQGAQVLAAMGADPSIKDPANGANALIRAAGAGSDGVAVWLAEQAHRFDLDPNAVDDAGNTALGLAVGRPTMAPSLVFKLLQAGASPNLPSRGIKPIVLAFQRHQAGVCELLAASGANADERIGGRSLVSIALDGSDPVMATALIFGRQGATGEELGRLGELFARSLANPGGLRFDFRDGGALLWVPVRTGTAPEGASTTEPTSRALPQPESLEGSALTRPDTGTMEI